MEYSLVKLSEEAGGFIGPSLLTFILKSSMLTLAYCY